MTTHTATGKESTGPTIEVSTDEYDQPQERVAALDVENEQLQPDPDETENDDATSFLFGVLQTVTDALDSAREENEELRTENEALREDQEQLREEFHAYRKAAQKKFERVEETQEIHDSRLDAVADGIDRVEAESSDAESGVQTEETTLYRPETRLERIFDDPQNCGEQITASVSRAIDIVGHFKNWSKKVPAGCVIREGLRNLLSTVEGEHLDWKQVYRAGHKLDELTNGRIEFKKTDRYGWILVLRDESYLDALSTVVSDRSGG